MLQVLREVEAGETAIAVCRRHGISQQTRYQRKRKCAGLGLREGNAELKRLVADISRDHYILQDLGAPHAGRLATSEPWCPDSHQLSVSGVTSPNVAVENSSRNG